MGKTPTRREFLPVVRLRRSGAWKRSQRFGQQNSQYSLSVCIMNGARALFLGHNDDDDVKNDNNDVEDDNNNKNITDVAGSTGHVIVG